MCGEWQEKRAGGDIEDEEWDWEREVEEWDKERDRVEEAAEEWEEEVEFLKYKPLSHHTGTTRAWTGADLARAPAHHRSRLSDSVKNGNALRTMHNAALPAR